MKRKFLSLVLAAATALPGTCLQYTASAETALDDSVLVSETFDGTGVPEGFVYTTNWGAALNVENGRLVWTSISQNSGGVYFDLSNFADLDKQKCEKLVFEYDYYPEKLTNDTNVRYHYINLTDKNDNRYVNFFAELTGTQQFYAPDVPGSNVYIKSWNVSNEDVDEIYGIKMILDITNKKKSVKITRKNADGTGEKVTYNHITNMDYSTTTDGTLSKLWLTRLFDWGGEDLRVSFDNFKIYKEGAYGELDCQAANDGKLPVNGKSIRINFTNKIDINTVSAITVKDNDGNDVNVNISASGNVATLSGDFKQDKTYTVTVGTDVMDIFGQKMQAEKTLTFKIDKNLLVYEDFGSEAITEKFEYTEENGTTLKVEDGKLVYARPNYIGSTGGFWYDLSSVANEKRYNKIVFEYDMELRDIKLHSSPSYFNNSPVLTDGNGKKYFNIYTETQEGGTPVKLVAQLASDVWVTDNNIKAWNAAEENANVYYKIKETIDIAGSKQKFEYAEMTAGTSEAPQWKTFGERGFFEATNGTFGKLHFITPTNWNNVTMSVDNFKITTEGESEKGIVTTVVRANGKVTATVLNQKNEKVTYKSILGVYNSSGELINVISQDGELEAGSSTPHVYEVQDDEKVKVFTWDSLKGIKPFNQAIAK